MTSLDDSYGFCATTTMRADADINKMAPSYNNKMAGGAGPYKHLLGLAPSRDSVAFTSTKGLLNGPGQNNCFLNSAVQVLWHLDIFRRSFRELSGHACMAESCIFCALKELFGQLQFSQESALPPDALRRALAESFFDQQRFQLGFMDDAAECFENILLRIHYHIASNEVEDMCNARHCIPHQKFAMTLVEQSVCEACHVTSEPLSYTQMVHYVSASALTTQARQAGKSAHPDFGQLLRKAGGMGDIRDCPSSCGAKIQICRALMNRPEIVSVGVVWDSERPTLQHIMAVFATIGTSLRLSDVFHSVMDHRWAATTTHALVGVVTYYGKHYSTFFFHTKLRVWIYFDDATVREIGPRFEQVVEKCRRGRYQPLLLLYAVQGGTPVATDGAPKTIVQIPVNRDTMKARSAAKPSPSPSLPRSSAMPGPHSNPSANTLPPLRCSVTPNTSPSLPLRRSVTPSPEKTQSAPNSTSPRRAITPNPEVSHHRTISRSYSDYQNLTDIQASIFNGVESEPSYISRKAVESVLTYQKQNPVQRTNSVYSKEGDKKVSLQRTYSDGIAMPEHLNIPRRRDSGNWSGDRNSASSSSSMENPYLYLVGKLQARNQAVPRSPTSTKPPGEVFLDPGYDSYSLSSNDSLPLQQGLKHNLQLAQIPEHLPPQTCVYPARLAGDECEHLCLEADQLLDKSKQLEEARDLETALVLCQAAAGKARAAMDAPYNNPQTLTFARMKHNTCVMRVRSLHRRLLQAQAEAMGEISKEDGLKISHSREGSGSSNRSGGHSRQGSRDKTSTAQHSRQSSRELASQLPVVTTEKPTKNIEIYATLPKKKLGGSLRGNKAKNNADAIEDEEYMYDRPGRSLYSRGAKKKEEEKITKEKRARSEERNKSTREYLLGNISLTLPKDSPNKKDSPSKKEKEKAKEEAAKAEKAAGEAKQGKKQHKIRRKLLLGGLIRRKNRSMPDLREGNGVAVEEGEASGDTKATQDDSVVGTKGGDKSAMSGYLSEGHLEYTGNGNPNMERSRLMRKSFHGSAGKVLHAAKVPPPPPLRTTSQLTNKEHERPPYPLPTDFGQTDLSYESNLILHRLASGAHNPAVNEALFNAYNNYNRVEPQSLPYMPTYNDGKAYEPVTYANGVVLLERAQNNLAAQNQLFQNSQTNQVQRQYNPYQQNKTADEVFSNEGSLQNLALPPYPSPPNSVNHSRQASEDFPLPPPPLEHLLPPSVVHQHSPTPSLIAAAQESPNSLLAQLQQKRQQILDKEGGKQDANGEVSKPKSGEEWLKELQAKQAERKLKKGHGAASDSSRGGNAASSETSKENLSSVKDLASRFENIRVHPVPKVQICETESRKNATPNSHSPLTVPSATNERVAPVPSTEHLPVSSTTSGLTNCMSSVNNGYETSTNRTNLCSTSSHDNLLEAAFDNSVLTKKLNNSSSSLDYLSNNVKNKGDSFDIPVSNHNSLDSRLDAVDGRRKSGKKKNVTFCDQVILVATAEDEEDDSFIPNPILERVLRSAFKHDGSGSMMPEAKITTVPLRPSQSLNASFEREASSYPGAPLDTRPSHKQEQEAMQDQRVQYKQLELRNSEQDVVQQQGHNQSQYQPPPQSYRLDRQLQEAYLNSNLRPISYQQNPPTSQTQTPPHSQNSYYQPSPQTSQTQNPPQPQMNYYQTNPQAMQVQNPPQSQVNYYPQNSQPQQTQTPPQPQTNYYQQNTQPTQNPPQAQTNYYQQTSQPQQTQIASQPQVNYYQQNPQPQMTQNPPQPQNYYQPQQNYPATVPQRQQYQEYQQQVHPSVNTHQQHSAFANHQSLPTNAQPVYQRVPHPTSGAGNQDMTQRTANYPTHQEIMQRSTSSMETSQRPVSHQLSATQHQLSHQEMLHRQTISADVGQRMPNNQEFLHRQTTSAEVAQRMPNNQELAQRQISHPQTVIHQANGQRLPSHQEMLRQASMPRQTSQEGVATQRTGSQAYPPYQHPPPPRQVNGTRPVYQPLPDDAVRASPCHLCRKKPVAPPAVYCTDCHFYMSRFKPRTQ